VTTFAEYCAKAQIRLYFDPPTSNRGLFYVDMVGPDEYTVLSSAFAEFLRQIDGYRNVWLRVAPTLQTTKEIDDLIIRCRFRGVYW
jgi:hypothetical protein